MRIVHADAVIAGDTGALRDGAIVIDDEGRVVDLGPAADVRPRHAGLPVDTVRGVVMPGLVNAHTHIELSALGGRVPAGGGFVRWVDALLDLRAEAKPDDDADAIERAVDALVAYGTAAVGDVTNTLAAVRVLARRGMAGCVFHEVLGIEREPLERRVAELPRALEERVGDWPSAALSYAVAPHALYTTHLEVARALVRAARERGVRTSIHLAEHPAERRALEQSDGPVVDWLHQRMGIDPRRVQWPGKSPVHVAEDLGILAPHIALVHLTDARPAELALVARRGAPVVLCPRSNLFIEARLPPLLAAREAGILLALGTDSLASNTSLDVLAEAQVLAERFPSVMAEELLRMATWGGARALGLDGRDGVGRIARGARPGLLAIEAAEEPSGLPPDASARASAARSAWVDDPCGWVIAHARDAARRWVARRA